MVMAVNPLLAGEQFKVKCEKERGNLEWCDLSIRNSVLQGRNGKLITVSFSNGYLAEAFCLDSEGNNCLVRSKNSRWENGRLRWDQNYPVINPAFLIENSYGLLLGTYEAPSEFKGR